MEIKDAVAVVTGGASGLGLATAEALLAEGAKLVAEGVVVVVPVMVGEDVPAFAVALPPPSGEGVGGAEDGFFSETGTDQLQSDGQI